MLQVWPGDLPEFISAPKGTILGVIIKGASGEAIDISAAMDMKIILQPPSTAKMEKDAVFTTGGQDGALHYVTVSGDLSEEGVWKIQGYVQLPSGIWHSKVYTFRVYPNL